MAQYRVADPTGQEHIIEGPENATPDEILKNAQSLIPMPEQTSAVGSFGRGAASMLPGGSQAYSGVASVLENEPYLKERQDFEKLLAAGKEEHPAATMAGQGAGLVAPLLIPGAGEVSPILAGAGMGAAAGAGSAADTLATGGSKEDAVKKMLLQTGFGAAGGAAGQAIGNIAAKAAPMLEDISAEASGRAAGLNKEVVQRMAGETGGLEAKGAADDFSNWVKKNVGLSNDPAEMLKVVQNQSQRIVGEVQKIPIDNIPESFESTDFTDTLSDKLNDINLSTKLTPSQKLVLKDSLYSNLAEKTLTGKVEGAVAPSGSGGMMMGGLGRLAKMLPDVPRRVAGASLIGAGHLIPGAIALMPDIGNPVLQSKLASGAANMVGQLPSKLGIVGGEIFPKFLDSPLASHYKPIFQQAIVNAKDPAEAQKIVATTDFVLSQRDPDYNQVKQKASEGMQ